MPLISFFTTWNHQKTSGFLMFSGGVERPVAWNWWIDLYVQLSVQLESEFPFRKLTAFCNQRKKWCDKMSAVYTQQCFCATTLYFSLLHVLDLCSMLYSLLNSKHIITMSRKHNTNTKIRIILKLEKRVMIMNSSMFLWHMQPICFIDFQKGGILIKGGNDLKRRGLGTLSELCSFIHLTHQRPLLSSL